jgi:hypothetical protein
METVFLNSSNLANRDNNRLVYRFQQSVKFKKAKVALKSLSIYYSWFNISADYRNNSFQYNWFDPSGELTDVRTITIPDGNYDISTLNEYLQSKLIANQHYVTRSSNGVTSNVYFLSCYRIQHITDSKSMHTPCQLHNRIRICMVTSSPLGRHGISPLWLVRLS